MHDRHRLYLAFAFVAAGSLGGCASVPILVDSGREEGGQLFRCGRQHVLVLRGSPYEMGRQHGRLLASAVRVIVPETLAWTNANGLSREELGQIYAALEPHIPERYKAEMQGLADGSGVAVRELQLLHAMPSRFHCSGAAVAGSMTSDGKLYHSRSLDYALDLGVDGRIQNEALLTIRVPTDGIASAVPSWAGFLGAVTGMNLRGISVGEKGSASRDESFAGMPMIFTVREVLRRATTLDEAVDTFRQGPRTRGFNFIVGSGDERQAVAIEVTRSQFFVSGFGDPAEAVPPHTALPDAVRRTNHFVGRATANTQRRPGQGYDPERYMAGSWRRYQAITGFLSANRGRLDAARMVALLRRYPPGHSCLHQVVMCPTDRRIWVSQAVDDRTSATAGAQNQDFYGYDLRALVAGTGAPVVGRLLATTQPLPNELRVRRGQR